MTPAFLDSTSSSVSPVMMNPPAFISISSRERPARSAPILRLGMMTSLVYFGGAESVEQDTVADLSRDAEHVGVDGGDVHLHVRVRYRARVEEGRHEVEVVVVAVELYALPCLPGVPDVAQGLDVLTHTRGRRGPVHAESADDVTAHLAAESKSEASAGHGLEVPAKIGDVHGAAGEGEGDGRSQLGVLGMLGGYGERQKGVVVGLC